MTFFASRAAMRQRAVKGPNGKYRPVGRLTLGLRSQQLAWVLDGWVSAKERGAIADLGGPPALAATRRSLVRLWARAAVLEDITWSDMNRSGGPTSAKGHKRRCADQNGQYADRTARLAKDVGLDRKARPVESAGDLIE